MEEFEKKIIQEITQLKTDIKLISNKLEKQKKIIINTMYLLNKQGDETYTDIQKRIFSVKYKNDLLNEVQPLILEILYKFQNFCKSNGVAFWLHAGTLIGAVRNSELISWDDDADIALFRDDFDKLRKLTSIYKTDFYIDDYYNDIKFCNAYQLKYKKCPIVIDIAVFDKIKSDRTLEQISKKYREIRVKMNREFNSKKKAENFCLLPNDYHHFSHYPNKVSEKCQNIIKKYKKEFIKSVISTRGNAIEYVYLDINNFDFPYPILKKDEFTFIEGFLSNKSFLIPKNWNIYLSGYGNIFEVPSDVGNCPHSYVYEKSENRELIHKYYKELTHEFN